MKRSLKLIFFLLALCIINLPLQASEKQKHIQFKEDLNQTTTYSPDHTYQKTLIENKSAYEKNRDYNTSKKAMRKKEWDALQTRRTNLLKLPDKRRAIMQSKNKEIADMQELHALRKENIFYKNSFQLTCASLIVGGTALYLFHHCI